MQAVRTSIIYGFCGDSMFRDVEADTLAMLSEPDKKALLFCYGRDMNVCAQFQALTDSAPRTASHDSIEITFLFQIDQCDSDTVAKMLEGMQSLRDDLHNCGVADIHTNLVWLLKEQYPKEYDLCGEYRKIEAIGVDCIFFVSERNSALITTSELLGEGVAELIAYEACCNKADRPYKKCSFGYKRLELTDRDIRRYAKHQVADRIRHGTVGEENASFDELVKSAFGGKTNWCDSILEEIQAMSTSCFCYIEDGAVEAPKPLPARDELEDVLQERIINPWRERLLRLICQRPCRIDFATQYFALNGDRFYRKVSDEFS
ncbi:MAG: hypothetical protein RR482_02325, partial [Clostridia bacterium]